MTIENVKITNTSIQPEQKIGHWIINSDGYYPYCSICKDEPQNRVMTKYCPNCGAYMKMVERT